MRYYELMIIFDSGIADETIREQIEAIKSFISSHEGEIKNIEEWGRRRLAYPIKKKESGYYTLFQFSMTSSTLLSGLDRTLRINETVLRYMTVKISAPTQPKPKPEEKAEEGEAATANSPEEALVAEDVAPFSEGVEAQETKDMADTSGETAEDNTQRE